MVDVRFARPEERAAVARFMARAFPRAKWGMDGWTALLDGRWAAPGDGFAIVACDKAQLVGVLGLVYARRPTALGLKRTANMSSWYVLKEFRGQGLGQRMLALATADPSLTVTNFTSAPGAVSVVRAAGFQILDRDRLIWHPAGRSRNVAVREVSGPDPALPAGDQQVLRDHEGLPLRRYWIDTAEGGCLVLLAVKQKSEDVITHEVYHLGNPQVFATYTRAIASALLPPDGAMLSVDRRLLPGDIQPDAVQDFAVPRFYSPADLPPGQIDHLYTETVLLDQKLY